MNYGWNTKKHRSTSTIHEFMDKQLTDNDKERINDEANTYQAQWPHGISNLPIKAHFINGYNAATKYEREQIERLKRACNDLQASRNEMDQQVSALTKENERLREERKKLVEALKFLLGEVNIGPGEFQEKAKERAKELIDKYSEND